MNILINVEGKRVGIVSRMQLGCLTLELELVPSYQCPRGQSLCTTNEKAFLKYVVPRCPTPAPSMGARSAQRERGDSGPSRGEMVWIGYSVILMLPLCRWLWLRVQDIARLISLPSPTLSS